MGSTLGSTEVEDQNSGRRLKGERRFREGARKLNFYKTKRSERSKYGDGRLATPEDVGKEEGEADIFKNTLKEKGGEVSADEVPKTPYPDEASADAVPEVIPENASPDEEVVFPNEESADVAMDIGDNEDLDITDEFPNEDKYSKTSAPTFAPIATETTVPPVPMPTVSPTFNPPAATDAPTMEPTETVEAPSVDEFKPTSRPTSVFFEMPSGSYDEALKMPTSSPLPKKKTYAPAYYKPIPTPRPTKAAPAADPTRRPTKLTPRPTEAPTLSAVPSVTPSISPQPSASPTRPQTEAPTLKPSTSVPTAVPTAAPTAAPTDTDPPTESPTEQETFDRSACVSGEDGSYGVTTAPETQEVGYRYQVEATSTYTVDGLNNEALPEAEKEISDVLVPRLFFPNGECDDGVAEARGGVAANLNLEEAEDAIERASAQKWALGLYENKKRKSRGGRTTGWEIPSGHRLLQEEDDRLFGLSASPPDIVIRGRLQNACPNPVGGTGPDGQPLICWVIQGAITLYGSGDLSWANDIVQEALNSAMNNGEFDNGAINPNVIYVRHIPQGTVLNVTVDQVRGEPEDDDDGTPVWAWVLIGLGVGGLLLVLAYLITKRRQQQQEFERQKAETEFLAGENAGDGDGDGDGGESKDDTAVGNAVPG